MIYDCFCLFNELDLLEIRLNSLSEVVDRFVICESSVTHTGKRKPFYFEENKQRYSGFLDRIIHIKVEDTPDQFVELPHTDDPIYKFIVEQDGCRFNRETEVHYGRDFFQKEACRRGLVDCKDNDIVIFSDCDEFPDPEAIKSMAAAPSLAIPIGLHQPMHYYFADWYKESWVGSRIAKYGMIKNYSLNELRAYSGSYLSGGGCHLSYLGGPQRVREKLEAFSAQELVNQSTIELLDYRMQYGMDLFGRGRAKMRKLSMAEMEKTHPKFLLENQDRFSYMFSSSLELNS